MSGLVKQFVRCESGATAIEYCFLASLIAVVIVAALTVLGMNVSNSFQNMADGFPS
ncbi:MAG: Flp family type IVb pilin [Pseudomonadota bacterium]